MNDYQQRLMEVDLEEVVGGMAPPDLVAPTVQRASRRAVRHLRETETPSWSLPGVAPDGYSGKSVSSLLAAGIAVCLLAGFALLFIFGDKELPEGMSPSTDAEYSIRDGAVTLDHGMMFIKVGAPPLNAGNDQVRCLSGMALIKVGAIPTPEEMYPLKNWLSQNGLEEEMFEVGKWIKRGGLAVLLISGSITINGEVLRAGEDLDKPKEGKEKVEKETGDEKAEGAKEEVVQPIDLSELDWNVINNPSQLAALPADWKAVRLHPFGFKDSDFSKLARLIELQGLYMGGMVMLDVGDDEELSAVGRFDDERADNITFANFSDDALEHVGKLTSLRSLSLFGDMDLTDKGLEHVAALSRLQFLNLFDCEQITGPGLKHLAGLKMLETLDLGETATELDDSGLEFLTDLKALQRLSLAGPGRLLTDKGLKKYIAPLKELRYLNLSGCAKFGDSTPKALTGLTKLETLVMKNTLLTDKGLKSLAKLKSLQSLRIPNTKVTGKGFKAFAKLKSLTRLDVSMCDSLKFENFSALAKSKSLTRLDLNWNYDSVTDEALPHIARIKTLTSLSIQGADLITDAGLARLAALTSLEHLDLTDCVKLTDAGVEALRTKLPSCTIIR